MLRLLQFLLFGHSHKWKETSRCRLNSSGGSVGVRIICVCERCGRPKNFDLI